MKAEEILNRRRQPACLIKEEAAVLLGLHPDAVDFLADIGHLEALGGTPRGVRRMFASVYIEELTRDIKWLAKATIKIRQLHQQRNSARRSQQEANPLQPV